MTTEYGYSYSEPTSYGADGSEPAYYGSETPAYYGAEGEEQSFLAKTWSAIQGYAARVSSNMSWSLGAGAVTGLGVYLLGEDEFGGDSSIGDAIKWGLIAAGTVHVASTLIAGGFAALQSASAYYGLGMIAAGFAAPMVSGWVMERADSLTNAFNL